MIFLYIANFLTVLIFLSYGRIINSFLFPGNKKEQITANDIISGIIYLSFIGIFINFFFPLSLIINNFIFFLGIIFLFFNFYKKVSIPNTLRICLIISSISFLIMIFENSNRPDAGLYHLPFISILNEHKIILGISNVHFRFGHTSIVQYTSAIFNNSLFYDKGITIPISIIIATIFLYFYQNFRKKNNNFFLVFFFLIVSFITLKVSRYDDIGNDSIGHLFYFLTVSYFLICFYKKKFKYENFFLLFLFSLFTFANKIFLILSIVFPFFFIIWTKKFHFILDKRNLILFFFISIFLLKNVLISSCIIYPLKISCFKNLSWSSVDKNTHSSPEYRSLAGKVHAKAWVDYKDRKVSFEEYNHNFNWIKTWSETHLKYLFKKLIPLYILIIFLTFHFLYHEKKNSKTKKNITQFIKSKYLALIVSLFGSIYWFLNFPIYRYGYSLFVSGTIILIAFLINKYFTDNNKKKINILNKILIIFFIFVIGKNITKIQKYHNIDYVDKPWPKIYAFDKENIKQKNIELLKFKDLRIYSPVYRLCMYSPSPCTNFKEIKKQIKIIKKFNYYLIIPKV